MHSLLILLHRWLGLFTALFLFIAGLTGAVIAWEHELDEWLNPQLFKTQPTVEGASKPLSPLALAEQVETADPQVRVTYLPLAVKPGHTLIVFVEPRVNPATGALFTSDYNQVALAPTTGEIQGRRLWGALKLSRENVLPFLYKLHYSLHLPESGEISWGVWLMGLVAIVWVLDTLIAFWIAFPARGSWRKSFAFRWRQGGAKLNFDLHRSGGVWVWGVLLIVAVTAVSMNLEYSVMRPVVSLFSPLTSSPFDNRAADPPLLPVEPRIERERALEIARVEAERRGWIAPPGGLSYLPAYGVYGIGFFTPDDERGTGSLGNPWLYLDGEDGALLAVEVLGEGTFGDVFMQAQFPLHSGRILGLPGRVLISVLGLVVPMLAVTGIIIWAKKRRVRMSRRVKQRRRARTEEALTG